MSRSPDSNEADPSTSFHSELSAGRGNDANPASSRKHSIRQRSSQMELRGVRVHNLKNIDLDIPLDQLVVISGVSGSGKSSLAFDTIFAEGQRRYIESFSIASRKHLERIERPDADRIAHLPVTLAIRSDRTSSRSGGRAIVATQSELLDSLRLLFARIGQIVCPDCATIVSAHTTDDLVATMSSLPTGTRCQLVFEVQDRTAANWLARGFSRAILEGASHQLEANTKWPKTGEIWLVVDRWIAGKAHPERITESAATAFREGQGRCMLLVEGLANATTANPIDACMVDAKPCSVRRFSQHLECPSCQRPFLPIEPRLFNHYSTGACATCRGTGVDPEQAACPTCEGTRFRAESLAVKIADHSIADLLDRTSPAVLSFLNTLGERLSSEKLNLSQLIRTDLKRRLTALCELGLDYLKLNRGVPTLSGGETRRLSLAALIGSKVTGTLVVVDEPSAGLSEPEFPNVINALRRIQALRNSVIVVDHAPQIVAAADDVIELGPGAGPQGGAVVFHGRPIATDESNGHPAEPASRPIEPATTQQALRLTNFARPPWNEIDIHFPLGKLCVVTGPSGSGKTSLVTHTLFPAVCRQRGLPCSIRSIEPCDISGAEALTDVVLIDQSPLTRSSRSNPATWLEVFDEIRETFANTSDARHRGFDAIQFSFNSTSGGRCRSCLGTGILKHDMQFLPDITLTCPECRGARYRPEILDVKYRGRSIADVLAMTIAEAATFFRSQPRLQSRFQILKQIGLDYLVLGQPSETLSGGEAQRLKLASRIIKPVSGRGLIISDEPTTGLHPRDVRQLVACFRELLANGQSIVVADTSPELIAAADEVIRLNRSGLKKAFPAQ